MPYGCVAWTLAFSISVAAYFALLKAFPSKFTALNYLGRKIPSSSGVVIAVASILGFAAVRVHVNNELPNVLTAALILTYVFGLLGLADDLYGDRSIGGLRGHLGALFAGKVTTGAAKAIGGAGAALYVAYILHPHNLGAVVLDALIIALSANAVNLTDTRPGRSLAITLVLAGAAILFMISQPYISGVPNLIIPFLIAFVLFLFDRSGRTMIGDVGSNTIGSLLGLLWVLSTPIVMQLSYAAALILFHRWTESHSLSATIDKTPWLRSIDRRIGIRQ